MECVATYCFAYDASLQVKERDRSTGNCFEVESERILEKEMGECGIGRQYP